MGKGISTVIATLLMLIITIALAGFAYTYISGVLTVRTAVVLTPQEITCLGEFLQVTVRNDGTSKSGLVSVDITDPSGAVSKTCSIASIDPGTSGQITVAASAVDDANCSDRGLDRPAGMASGTYRIRITGGSSPATGNVFCASTGTGT